MPFGKARELDPSASNAGGAKQKTLSPKQTPSIQSLDRGLTILEVVARSTGPVSLGELTKVLDIDRSSVFRLAGTLKRRGFLTYPAGRKDYILGPSLWRLAHKYDWGNMLIKVSHEQLKVLASKTKETAQLAVREGNSSFFIDCAAADQVISISGRIGESTPLYCTAHGKALIADLDAEELEVILSKAAFQSYTKRSVVSVKLLAKICSETKMRGYAIDDEEYIEGVRCVAAPVRAEDGQILGAIGISAPLTRFPRERYEICGRDVMETAASISNLLSSQSQDD
ncbi:MAG TPA: IclR family transcriptional regulator [Bryobacteraceae bacterium]|jgi:IclR family acetate operon transcriptional repressor